MHSWIPNIRRGGVLHYENFIHNLPGELHKLVQYLELPLDKRRFQCTLKHNFKIFHRNALKSNKMYASVNYLAYSKSKIWIFFRNPYTNDQKEMIDDAIMGVQKLLVKNKWEPMPLEYYEYFNQILNKHNLYWKLIFKIKNYLSDSTFTFQVVIRC